jgi:hypothetical protein
MAKAAKRRIPPALLSPESDRVTFSLRHLDVDHPKFPLESPTHPAEFFKCLLLEIKRYEAYSVEQFKDYNNFDQRHSIYFPQTSEPNGFTNLSEDLQGEEGWQFALCPGDRTPPKSAWRVYGFMIDATFYVVWLDSLHQLYPSGHERYRDHSAC